MSDFLVSNRLKLNDDKTYLLVLTTSQTRRRVGAELRNVVISTPAKLLYPTPTEKLLGAWVHQDLKWSEHLQDNHESLLRALGTRLSAIKKISRIASLKTRKMIANGVFISKLSYLISVCGGCEGYLCRSLQVIQNKVARVVTRDSWSTPTSVLLSNCGFFSVRQLAMYHTVVLVFRVLKTGSPSYLHSMFSTSYNRATRQSLQGMIKPSQSTKVPKSDLATSSFRHRALQDYNLLSTEVRDASTLPRFKQLAKQWIMNNIPVD